MADSSKEKGIQLLLAAEAEAQQVVTAARQAKTSRLRQAKEEAERDAAAYRAQREQDYQSKKSGSTGDSDSTLKRLELETQSKIELLSKESAAVSKDVTAMLISTVTSVKV